MSRARPAVAAVAALAVVVAAAVWVVGRDTGSEASVECAPSAIPEHGDDTLIVEGDAWSGYAPLRAEDLMAGTGYRSVWVEQVCQDLRAADLTAGRADIAVTTLDQYLLNSPEGTLVGVIDQSRGADALALGSVHHPELDSIDDIPALVDRYAEDGDEPVLAYTGTSPSETLLNELANTTETLRIADFELVAVERPAIAYQMLQDDEAQLAIVREPDTSAARAAGYAITLSSADVPGAIVDVIVASDRLIERDPAAVRAVLSSYYSAIDTYLARPDELERLYAADGGLEPEAAGSLIAGIRLYGTADADAFMNEDVFPLDEPQVEQSVDSIGSVLALVHPAIDPDRAQVDGSYVRDLVR